MLEQDAPWNFWPLGDVRLFDFAILIQPADARELLAAHPLMLLRHVAIREQVEKGPQQAKDPDHIEHRPPAVADHDEHGDGRTDRRAETAGGVADSLHE